MFYARASRAIENGMKRACTGDSPDPAEENGRIGAGLDGVGWVLRYSGVLSQLPPAMYQEKRKSPPGIGGFFCGGPGSAKHLVSLFPE